MDESKVVQVKNPIKKDQYTDTKTVTVTPEETQRSVSYQAPTPEMQEYIQKNIIEPTQQAYGINPATGDVTPFQALGYNPEDERKRREAEMALNDRKRKENAWYNAFAVVGDALTAGLGGNVWQRKPNRIGEIANADNQRLIAEQKAEDINNAAILRNAGVKYADAVNRLIQNYLTKTTTTNKTGGGRTESTVHGAQNGYKYNSHAIRTGNGKNGTHKIVKLAVQDQNGNVTGYRDLTVPKDMADAYARKLSTVLQKRFDEGRMQGSMENLIASGIYDPTAKDPFKRWNYDALLQYGYSFDIDGMNSEMTKLWEASEEHKDDKKNGKKPLKLVFANSDGTWAGVQDDDDYDD